MSTLVQKIAPPVLLKESVRKQIDHWVSKFPQDQKQSAVIPALMIVQKDHDGWLTDSLMDAVAAYLQMPKIAVYEVATFYSMFELKPVGKHKICLCTNISCLLNGSDTIKNHLESKLKISMGETTEDKLFTLKEVECLGACGGAPMMQVGEIYHEHLSIEKVDQILKDLEPTV